jgi:hypothetical protein
VKGPVAATGPFTGVLRWLRGLLSAWS